MKTFAVTLLGSVLSTCALAGQFNVEPIKQRDIDWRFQRIHISPEPSAIVHREPFIAPEPPTHQANIARQAFEQYSLRYFYV